jgi:hypothetical protein
VIDVCALPLSQGNHDKPEDGMCVMEMASYLAREPWSDHPQCVSPVIAAFCRSWNDALDDETRQRLKPYAFKVVGTRTTEADEETRAWMATDWLCRVQAPAWLRLAGLTEHAQALESLARISDATTARSAQPTLDAAHTASAAAGAAARNAAWTAAGDAARTAAGDAARNAAWNAARAAAGDAARNAAGAAAWAAAGAAAWNAAWTAAGAAARNTAGDAAWNAARNAAGAAARNAARAAAGNALAPTVLALQESAFGLLDEMIVVGAKEAV